MYIHRKISVVSAYTLCPFVFSFDIVVFLCSCFLSIPIILTVRVQENLKRSYRFDKYFRGGETQKKGERERKNEVTRGAYRRHRATW